MLSGRCTYHPDRAAVGVCVICRTVICVECSTPIEGIHRCARCIGKMGRSSERSRPAVDDGHVSSLLIVLATFAGLTFFWIGLAALLG